MHGAMVKIILMCFCPQRNSDFKLIPLYRDGIHPLPAYLYSETQLKYLCSVTYIKRYLNISFPLCNSDDICIPLFRDAIEYFYSVT
jgi:hypothetical protein